MTANEALERRIDELCVENERLRQENQSIGMAAYELGRASLAVENAKLRELVLYAHECAIHSDHATCDDCRRMNGYCILERRMRELGVDEC